MVLEKRQDSTIIGLISAGDETDAYTIRVVIKYLTTQPPDVKT